jgi:hypothetical protein
MAKLTKGERKALPAKDFAGPGRTFPVENRAHAKAAIMDSKGKSDRKQIVRKAEAELKRTDKRKK